METIGLRQVISDLMKTGHTFLTGDKATLNTYQQPGDAKTTTSGGHDISIVLRIHAIRMDTLTGQSGGRLRTFPHIIKVSLLYIGQEFIIRLKIQLTLIGRRLCGCVTFLGLMTSGQRKAKQQGNNACTEIGIHRYIHLK